MTLITITRKKQKIFIAADKTVTGGPADISSQKKIIQKLGSGNTLMTFTHSGDWIYEPELTALLQKNILSHKEIDVSHVRELLKAIHSIYTFDEKYTISFFLAYGDKAFVCTNGKYIESVDDESIHTMGSARAYAKGVLEYNRVMGIETSYDVLFNAVSTYIDPNISKKFDFVTHSISKSPQTLGG